jgi:Putative heavy-metal-binding
MADVEMTTTQTIQDWTINRYCGIVAAHVVGGTGLLSDIAASLSDLFGGRSGTYQRQLVSLQEEVQADGARVDADDRAVRAGLGGVGQGDRFSAGLGNFGLFFGLLGERFRWRWVASV